MNAVKAKAPTMNHRNFDFDQLVRDFKQQLHMSINSTWAHDTSSKHCKELTQQVDLLVKRIIPIGQYAESMLHSDDETRILDFHILYDWSDMAKKFILLWRNILLEASKAHIQLKAEVIENTVFEALQQKSLEVIQSAANDLETSLLIDRPNVSQKQIEIWKLQNSPWEVYEKQLQTVVGQCNDILLQLQELSKVADQYEHIDTLFNTTFDSIQKNIEDLKSAIKEVCVNALTPENYEGSAVIAQLKGIKLANIEIPTLSDFVAQTEQCISLLPVELNVAIDTDRGKILYKELNLQKVTRSWIDTELMSSMNDCYTIHSNMRNQFELAKLNIRNSVEVEKQESESAEEKIRALLDNLIKLLTKANEKTENLQKYIEALLEQLHIEHIYKDDFLSLSLGATLQQYQSYQLKGWNRIQNWIQQQGLFVQNIRKSVSKEERLSISEKIVRVVRQRTPSPENTHYTNMFLTQGYIGDSFHVGRVEELLQAKLTVENWHLGFRGSILITGKRLSGKTAMGTLIRKRFFAQTTIILKPNSKIEVDGRFFDVTFQLKDALNFIVKYSLQTRFLIWIDDLSMWQDDKTTLGANVRSLLQIIDQFSNRLFFMVSMSNTLRDRLHQVFQLNNVFQTYINTDQMNIALIKEALWVRHNATQMTLIDEKGVTYSNTQLDKLIQKIGKATNGNIGEALQYWAFTIQKVNEEYVRPSVETYHTLPNFVNTDLALLLRTILLDRQTNEYILNKKFGSVFKIEYKPLLLRLFNLGVLHRYTNGFFGINPFIVNDIGEILARSIDMTFKEKKSV